MNKVWYLLNNQILPVLIRCRSKLVNISETEMLRFEWSRLNYILLIVKTNPGRAMASEMEFDQSTKCKDTKWDIVWALKQDLGLYFSSPISNLDCIECLECLSSNHPFKTTFSHSYTETYWSEERLSTFQHFKNILNYLPQGKILKFMTGKRIKLRLS